MKRARLTLILLSALFAAALGFIFTVAAASSMPSHNKKEQGLVESQPKKKQFIVAVYARCTFDEPPKAHLYVIPAKDGYSNGHCATTEKQDGAIGYTTNISEEKAFLIDGAWNSEIMVFVEPR
jgi:hypothetical protein